MKPSAILLVVMLAFVLGPVRAEAPAPATKPATIDSKPAIEAVMGQWRQARQQLEAELKGFDQDPKQQALLEKYRQALDLASISLEKLLELRSATPVADAKAIASATDQLKQQLLELRRIETLIKSGTGKAPTSSDLMGLLGKALSQQQEKAQATSKKLSE